VIDPYNITQRIFRGQPWTVAVMACYGKYQNLDWSQYDTKLAVIKVASQGDTCMPYQLAGAVLSQRHPSLSAENTKATFYFEPAATQILQLGDDSYRWYMEYSPAGSGAATSSVLCAGPACVYDAPGWGTI
jgi:hypothetical protein